jgi:tetratricopeptide (TPR) repeat protein
MYADDRDYLSQVEHVRELVRLQPGSGAAVRDLAQCLFNLGDFAGARRTLDTALSLDPGDPDTVLLDANLLAKEGKKEAGAARFEEAKALDAVHRAEEGKAPRDTITRDDTEPAAAPTGAAPPASAPGANTLAAPTGATP